MDGRRRNLEPGRSMLVTFPAHLTLAVANEVQWGLHGWRRLDASHHGALPLARIPIAELAVHSGPRRLLQGDSPAGKSRESPQALSE